MVSRLFKGGKQCFVFDMSLKAVDESVEEALSQFAGHLSDSGEGRRAIQAAIYEGAPVPVVSPALYQRFSSRDAADYQDKLLSALRFEFGGHLEKVPASSPTRRLR